MSTEIKALSDACAILFTLSIDREVLHGSNYGYSLLVHANRYLNNQIEDYFKSEAA